MLKYFSLGLLLFLFSAPIMAQDLTLYNAKKCSVCHGVKGEGNSTLKSPAIAGMEKTYLLRQLQNFKNGIRGTHPEDQSGITMVGNARLLSDSEMESIVTEISGLAPIKQKATLPGDPLAGKDKYIVCASCHGEKFEGNVQLNSPPLSGLQDWYIVNQLKKFKAGVRSGDPATDPIGNIMNAMAGTLATEQDMYDVAVYITRFAE